MDVVKKRIAKQQQQHQQQNGTEIQHVDDTGRRQRRFSATK